MSLAIFDMDGTLYNTNDVNFAAYQAALRPYQVNLDYDYYCQECNGRNYKTFLPQLLDDAHQAAIEDIHQYKKAHYNHFLDQVIINEHLFNIIQRLKPSYRIALVTTASRQNALELLDFTQKTTLFDEIITGEDVSKYKPDPEGFLLAIAHAQCSPQDTVIFEDSTDGIAAARQTGALVLSVAQWPH